MNLSWASCRRLLLALLILAPVVAGCAQSEQLQPKQSNVFLVSEERELAIGDEVVKEVEREYPVYQDAALTAYVDEIGQKLAAVSDRPNIPYTFKVLDSPIANAFAVPGGHIYVTRGILGILDDEAELAGIIGHEVGHVAARHSAKQIQNTTIASIGLVAIAILAGDKVDENMLRAADAAMTLTVLGYSRGDEYQADLLGAKYLYRAGYDPEGMVGAMEGLLELQDRDPMKIEEFLSSHPNTKERCEHLKTWIARIPNEDVWGGTPPGTKLRNREQYQRLAVPSAIYQGNDEIRATVENYRLAMVRHQLERVEKLLADNYQDDQGRNKAAYLAWLEKFFGSTGTLNFRITNLQTEPQRRGGVAKFDYVWQYTDAQNVRHEERGRAYVEMIKNESNAWQIISLRSVSL